MKKNSGVWIFVIGLLLVGLTLEVDSPWSYGFEVIENGGIGRNIKILMLQRFLGENMQIDIFFNPLGYLLMFAGASMLKPGGKFLNNVKVFSILGAVACIGKLGLPFVMSAEKVFTWIILCIIVEILSVLIIMHSFSLACKKQVDAYMFMEVGKDLLFGVEVYGFAVVFSYVAKIFAIFWFYFAKQVYYVILVVSYLAIIYFVWKIISYTRKLDLFTGEEEKNGN